MKKEFTKEFIEHQLKRGVSVREIGRELGYSNSNIMYWIKKWEIHDLVKPNKYNYPDEHLFNKINTKEKAYIVGYVLADGYINDRGVAMGCALRDREILDFIASYVGGAEVVIDNTYDKKKRRFPRARLSIYNKNIVVDFNKHASSKKDKRVPIIPKHLEKYLVQGFFDGDGCITWGRRKDRNRIWQKVQFTSQPKLLNGIQKILLKNGISSSIRERTDEDASDLSFTSKSDVLKFLDFIYGEGDFIILNRKYIKANALRQEFGEFGEPKNSEPSH